MTYRLRNILIAIGLAVLAALLTVFYVSNYKKSVKKEAETVKVMVASQPIPVGTLSSQIAAGHMISSELVPRKNIAQGAINNPSQIAGQIVTEPIYVGEQVNASRFGPITQAGVQTQLKGTFRAIQFKGDPNQILAGTVEEGDHVDFVANIKFPAEDSAKHFTRIIARDLLVLQTSGSGDASKVSITDPSGSGWVVLRATDQQAQKIYFAYANEDWALVLRPALNDADSPSSIEDAISILKAGLKGPSAAELTVIPGGK
jgi:Flp pilus assembly protein CpaB